MMSQTVHDLIRARWGVNTEFRDNPEQVDVDIADKVILRANPQRLAFIIVNLSSNTVFIRPSGVAATTNSFRIAPNGGVVAFNWEEDFILPTLEWHASSSVNDRVIMLWDIVIGPGG